MLETPFEQATIPGYTTAEQTGTEALAQSLSYTKWAKCRTETDAARAELRNSFHALRFS